MAKISCKACKFASWMKVHQCSWVNCSRSQTVSVQQLRRPQCHVQKFFSLSPGPLRNGTSCHQRQQQQALLTLLCQGPLKKHQLLFLHNAAPHSNKIINLISLYRKRTHFFPGLCSVGVCTKNWGQWFTDLFPKYTTKTCPPSLPCVTHSNMMQVTWNGKALKWQGSPSFLKMKKLHASSDACPCGSHDHLGICMSVDAEGRNALLMVQFEQGHPLTI